MTTIESILNPTELEHISNPFGCLYLLEGIRYSLSVLENGHHYGAEDIAVLEKEKLRDWVVTKRLLFLWSAELPNQKQDYSLLGVLDNSLCSGDLEIDQLDTVVVNHLGLIPCELELDGNHRVLDTLLLYLRALGPNAQDFQCAAVELVRRFLSYRRGRERFLAQNGLQILLQILSKERSAAPLVAQCCAALRCLKLKVPQWELVVECFPHFYNCLEKGTYKVSALLFTFMRELLEDLISQLYYNRVTAEEFSYLTQKWVPPRLDLPSWLAQNSRSEFALDVIQGNPGLKCKRAEAEYIVMVASISRLVESMRTIVSFKQETAIRMGFCMFWPPEPGTKPLD